MRLIVLIALIAVALALALPARAHNTKLRAAGSLVSGGLIQQNKPANEAVAEETAAPANPKDQAGNAAGRKPPFP